MDIKVYGSSGCKKCSKLKQRIEKLVKEEDLEDEVVVEKVEDMEELVNKGIMSTPAVSVDDEIKIKGRAPSKKELKKKLF